jgi:UDP-galactopyranose mutase
MKTAYVIGAGTAGATSARILKDNGFNVEVFETREYISGNCFDYIDEKTGCVVHAHGPHAIHTDSERVWKWLNQFATFNDFSVQVWANTNLGRIPIPYNDNSDKIIGRKLSDNEIKELVFKDYSEKMWGVKMEELPMSILNRVPVRRNGTEGSFTQQKFQGLPKNGFVDMFKNIFDDIPVHVNIPEDEWRNLKDKCDLFVYTGKVDRYFDYQYGNLSYRSLHFEHVYCPKTPYIQLNECNSKNKWNRAIDHSYWYNQEVETTIVTREYPVEYVEGINNPYYPMIFGKHLQQFEQYKPLMEAEKNTIFAGRTATYKYLTIDQTIARTANKLKRMGFADSILTPTMDLEIL